MPTFNTRQLGFSHLNGYEVKILKVHMKDTEERFPVPCFNVIPVKTPNGEPCDTSWCPEGFTAWPDELGIQVD